MANGPFTPLAQQLLRSRQLDELRSQRPLSHTEATEATSLLNRAYMRQWRAVQAERTRPRRRLLTGHAR